MEESLRFSLLWLLVLVLTAKGQGPPPQPPTSGPDFHCDQGYLLYSDFCYHFETKKVKTWEEAETYCVAQQGHLVSFHSEQELGFITAHMPTQPWVGLNDKQTENTFVYTDGTPADFLPWAPNQPDDWQNNEECVHLGEKHHQNPGKLNDLYCNSKKHFICKKAPQPPTSGPANPTPQCDLNSGWIQEGSFCYQFKSNTRKSWNAAWLDCVQDGGDLVSITSHEENNYVTGMLGDGHLDMWIGLTNLKCNKLFCHMEVGNANLAWSDATAVSYTNWAPDQPTIDTQVGSCIAIINDTSESFGNWTSHVCRYERPYMCKRPLNTLCPDAWRSFAGSCYWLVSNVNLLTTWSEALTKCSDLGAHLLFINSQEEQFFINGFLPDFHQVDIPDMWIGLSDKDQDGSFRWADKTAVEFSNYGSGWPRNTAGIWDCGQISTGNYDGKWETTNCFKSLGYVCEMTGGQNPKPTSHPDFHCDQGYLLYSDFCYHFETKKVKTWEEAETYCVAQQGHLVSFHSEQELGFITAHMPTQAWVGLNDKQTENTFVYTDGTPADFLPWHTNQPDNWQNNEDCVHLGEMHHQNPGKLNDAYCSSTKQFICKKAKGQGPPPQPPISGPELQQLLQLLQQQIQKLQQQVTQQQEQIQMRKVAFSAAMVDDESLNYLPLVPKFFRGSTLPFREVIANIGNAYDPKTGRFTAPVRGAYHFELHIHGQGDPRHGSGAWLMKNNQVICSAYERQPDHDVRSSNGATLLLEVGDVVRVRIDMYNLVFDNTDYPQNTFSGHMLFSM